MMRKVILKLQNTKIVFYLLPKTTCKRSSGIILENFMLEDGKNMQDKEINQDKDMKVSQENMSIKDNF